jgi:cyclophilin family peptidyl-prolyl cis-trans isomerase
MVAAQPRPVPFGAMPNRRTRDRQLRRLHQRRIMERRKQKRQRSLTMIIASVLVLSLTVGLVLILANRGSTPSASATPTTQTPTTPASPTVQASPGSNCGYTEKPKQDSATKGAQPLPKFKIDVNKTYTATVVTSEGTFVVDLDPKAAPCTVNSFVYLTDRHFYDGLTFHRIIKDFVIQGGDPAGNGAGGPGYSFNDELNNGLKYELGSIAMANSGPNTNGSQWFVVTGPQGESLPNSYSIFGKVSSGMDVVQKIGAVQTASGDAPVTPVTIEKITIKES